MSMKLIRCWSKDLWGCDKLGHMRAKTPGWGWCRVTLHGLKMDLMFGAPLSCDCAAVCTVAWTEACDQPHGFQWIDFCDRSQVHTFWKDPELYLGFSWKNKQASKVLAVICCNISSKIYLGAERVNILLTILQAQMCKHSHPVELCFQGCTHK